jgi:hypothetical protein
MDIPPTPIDLLLSVQCRLARLAVCHSWTEIARALTTFDGGPSLKSAELSRFTTPAKPGERARGWSIHTVQRIDRFLCACAKGQVPLALSGLPPGEPGPRERALREAAAQVPSPMG